MIKILIVLTGLLAPSLVASEPPAYGSSSDTFDINSISSYLDDDGSSSSSSSSSKVLGSGSYSYSSFSAPSPSSLPYKAPTQPSYPPLPVSTAATSVHPSFSSGSDGSSTFYSPPSYSSNGSPSFGSNPSFSSAPSYSSQPTSQYESHVSFGNNAGSYSTGFKSERPSSGGFSFPSSGAEAHSTNDAVRSTAPSFSSGISSTSNHNSGNYKKYTSFPSLGSSYKDPYSQSSYDNDGSQFSSSFEGSSSSFGGSSSPFSSDSPHFGSSSSFGSNSSPFGGSSSPFGSSDFDSRPYRGFGGPGSVSPDRFPGDEAGQPYQWGRPNPNSFPGDNNYRGPAYNDGPGPFVKDFSSYKGPNADLPYSPNSFGPRPHSPYGGHGGGRPSYRGKYSGSKGSRYPRHPRPSYSSGPRGYSGRPHSSSRYPPSYRSGGKSPYSRRY